MPSVLDKIKSIKYTNKELSQVGEGSGSVESILFKRVEEFEQQTKKSSGQGERLFKKYLAQPIFNKHKHLVLQLINRGKEVYNYLPNNLKEDLSIVKAYISTGLDRFQLKIMVEVEIPPNFWIKEEKYTKHFIKRHPSVLGAMPENIKRNREFLKIGVKNGSNLLEDFSQFGLCYFETKDKIKDDKELILLAIEFEPSSFGRMSLTQEMATDFDVISKVIDTNDSQNYRAIERFPKDAQLKLFSNPRILLQILVKNVHEFENIEDREKDIDVWDIIDNHIKTMSQEDLRWLFINCKQVGHQPFQPKLAFYLDLKSLNETVEIISKSDFSTSFFMINVLKEEILRKELQSMSLNPDETKSKKKSRTIKM